MYQKLLPQLCAFCKLPAVEVLDEEQLHLLRHKFQLSTESMFCANERGCEHCRVEEIGLAGTKGLSIVAEILIPDKPILQAIAKEDWVGVEKLWRGSRREGFGSAHMQGKTAFEHALYKASMRLIDPQDIETDFESFQTYNIFDLTLRIFGLKLNCSSPNVSSRTEEVKCTTSFTPTFQNLARDRFLPSESFSPHGRCASPNEAARSPWFTKASSIA